jgi:hypothetical protein
MALHLSNQSGAVCKKIERNSTSETVSDPNGHPEIYRNRVPAEAKSQIGAENTL